MTSPARRDADRTRSDRAPEGTFVTLRLRYLVTAERGRRVKNERYRRILERFTDHPDRVAFPAGRDR
ncbi:hypothetical protein MBEHAL_2675 [Halarchaeum acidiphilum MH1-52-1]|uniref:Uncharacterized protein n=1 Tax=Halarchaeum acidiphilum MH1-52-1 TaxID=1261545 RepID=U2YXX9_9EURY|nr:hypothetical protein [Halarchaeum acidiphilum]GAD53915.1 hypothetical protein MBEHAL_2675 [Halarchaeum acidiphilum MH1-52-1]